MSFLKNCLRSFFNPTFIPSRGAKYENLPIIKNKFKQFYIISNRYYADKVADGPIIKRYGYRDTIIPRGRLPRVEGASRLPVPVYR